MKTLWIGLNITGLALVLYAAFTNGHGYMIAIGFCCICISNFFKFKVFRRK